jgi:hypothetical protein
VQPALFPGNDFSGFEPRIELRASQRAPAAERRPDNPAGAFDQRTIDGEIAQQPRRAALQSPGT